MRTNAVGWIAAWLAAWSLPSCGGSECAFNSDCAAGSYCAMGACRVDCEDDSECSAGEVCTSFGQCAAGPDAGPPDAGARDAGRDSGRELDAGTDAGTDAGLPDEVCTPSTVGSVATDEDLDGAIDEGCPWHFGVPHPVPSISAFGGHTIESPRLSADGLRLYLDTIERGGTERVAVATRASPAAPFGRTEPVAHTLASGQYVSSFHLDAAELEMWAQVISPTVHDVMVAARTTRAAPFGPFVTPPGLNDPAAIDHHPYLRADGLELLFVSNRSGDRRIYRATRASTSADFGAPQMLTSEGAELEGATPSLSADGLTLFFETGGMLRRARRSSVDSHEFGAREDITELSPEGTATYFPSVHERTREIFFVSNRPGTLGVGMSVWRAEICRDGPCPERVIDCADGVRSADGLHCYRLGGSATTWSAARAACESAGAFLATPRTQLEMDLVWTSFSASAAPYLWMGAFDDMDTVAECLTDKTCPWGWVTGEQWTSGHLWSPSEPSNSSASEDCMVLWDGVGFGDFYCDGTVPFVCEAELWPTW